LSTITLLKGTASMSIRIAPSILAADFSRLGQQVQEVESAGADRIHVDVMDGHFVPNLSMGPAVVRSLRPVTRLPLEVHLMVENPVRFVDGFLGAGADSIIVHQEVLADPTKLIEDLHGLGKRLGIAIKPATPVESVQSLIGRIDLVLCMTVEPGFGGQDFLAGSPEKIARLRRLIDRSRANCELEVDGGIENHTAPLVARAGAGVLVAGTAIFGAPVTPAQALADLRLAACSNPDEV
jgi:ribulose-phosphate 3-epimerase